MEAFSVGLKRAVDAGKFTDTAAAFLGGDGLAPAAIRYTDGFSAVCLDGSNGAVLQAMGARAPRCSPTFNPGVTVTVYEPESRRRK